MLTSAQSHALIRARVAAVFAATRAAIHAACVAHQSGYALRVGDGYEVNLRDAFKELDQAEAKLREVREHLQATQPKPKPKPKLEPKLEPAATTSRTRSTKHGRSATYADL